MSSMHLQHKILSNTPISILNAIYPYPYPEHHHNKRTKDLKILCLGLGRTGTDSLRLALTHLGYTNVYHGYTYASGTNHDALQWYRLHSAEFGPSPDLSFLTTENFDKILGECEAVVDSPACLFGVELLRLYPDAKVVLNRRNDVDAWHRSYLATLDKMYVDWPSWSRQWFDAETFWIVRSPYWLRQMTGFDFGRNGKEWYRRHYGELEAELRLQGREWLDWEAGDGWEPLCKFLGVEVPKDQEFPHENASGGAGFDARRAEIHRERIERAFRRMKIFGGGMALTVMAMLVWVLRS